MPGKIISIENAEKIANYNKLEEELKQEKTKTDYWKNEHFQVSLKNKELRKTIKQLTKENESLKEIIAKVNRGNNERK